MKRLNCWKNMVHLSQIHCKWNRLKSPADGAANIPMTLKSNRTLREPSYRPQHFPDVNALRLLLRAPERLGNGELSEKSRNRSGGGGPELLNRRYRRVTSRRPIAQLPDLRKLRRSPSVLWARSAEVLNQHQIVHRGILAKVRHRQIGSFRPGVNHRAGKRPRWL